MELGLYTFADVDPNSGTGKRGPDAALRLKHLLEEIELADQVGLETIVACTRPSKPNLVHCRACQTAAPAMGCHPAWRRGRTRLSSVGRLHRCGVGGGSRSLGLGLGL